MDDTAQFFNTNNVIILNLFSMPHINLSQHFTAAGPRPWNNLPLHLRDFELSLSEFRRLLKTQFFGWRSRRLVTYF